METRAPLPVSILVPTRNSMSLLPKHVETLRQLQPLAQEIVVVDSESNDGTVELLRREFPQARFLTHPPGLYESWNFGVNACAAEFVYISTVGDSISPEGLHRLVTTAIDLRCDVVISPPTLIDERGVRVTKSWPIYDLLGASSIKRATVFGPEETLLFAFAYLRKAILGSSASNIYRTECLRARPFPTDFGHAGDVGWGLRHCGDIRLGIVPEWFSKFVFHPRVKRVAADRDALRVAAARETLARVQDRIAPQVLRVGENLCAAWERLFDVKARRENQSLWMLRPSGWRDRWEQNEAEVNLLQHQGEALTLIETSLRT
jgi:glycosyltransferase involved in cell wall biosynthesis